MGTKSTTGTMTLNDVTHAAFGCNIIWSTIKEIICNTKLNIYVLYGWRVVQLYNI